jgi:hypothetical protein
MTARLGLLVLTGAVLAPAVALGQPRNPPDETKTKTLVLHPAPAPKPALKYLLLPTYLDRKPGNAAVWYGKVTAEQRTAFGNQKLWERIPKLLEGPLADLPRELRDLPYPGEGSAIFYFLDEGARRDSCNWELPLRDHEWLSILIPEAQQTRQFASLLALRVRLHLAEGKFDKAVQALQTGYALGRDAAQGQTLVHALIGMAICNIMSEQLEQLIQQPGAPNMYWALTNLPRPLIDLRAACEGEMAGIYLSYPELRDLEHKDYPPQQWQQLLDKMIERFGQWAQFTMPPDAPIFLRYGILGMILQGYPQAKEFLIQKGHTAAEVEAMPVAKVVLLYTMQTYDELRDDVFKSMTLPFSEGRQSMLLAERSLVASVVQGREILPIGRLLLPAVQKVTEATARTDRTIALLRIIEALRLYGASHDGRLPEKLNDITEVPVPVDPLTGQPFAYQRTGETAVLDASTHGIIPAVHGVRYEIRFAAKGIKP